jgi:16S rRNA U516 pseudouridylate synthase RsuA-like enzyme
VAEGAIQHRIIDPRHKLPKSYVAQVEGMPSATALKHPRVGDWTIKGIAPGAWRERRAG